MENGLPTETGSELEKPAVISDASTSLPVLENTDAAGSRALPERTTATTRKGSRKIWKSAALAELKSKAGLVAGALADFQAARGLVAAKEQTYEVDGQKYTALRITLVIDGANLVAVNGPDGLDFDVVAVRQE